MTRLFMLIVGRGRRSVVTILILATCFVLKDLKAEQIPPAFDKNAVQFLFVKAGTNFFAAATSFAISLPVYFKFPLWKKILIFTPIPQRIGFLMGYYVTSKHVLYDETGQIRHDLYMRIGKRKGGFDFMQISAAIPDRLRILTNADPSVDIAVISERMDNPTNLAKELDENKFSTTYKVASLPISLVKNKRYFDMHPVHDGQDLFFVGLFTPFYGSQDNIPVSRFGHITMTSTEKIPFTDTHGKTVPQNLFVMETQVFGGNSGSPAFFYKSRWTRNFFLSKGLTTDVYLAGVVEGYWPDYTDLKLRNSTVTPVSQYNTGISVIVPAYYLYEIIYSKNETKYRQNIREMKQLWRK